MTNQRVTDSLSTDQPQPRLPVQREHVYSMGPCLTPYVVDLHIPPEGLPFDHVSPGLKNPAYHVWVLMHYMTVADMRELLAHVVPRMNLKEEFAYSKVQEMCRQILHKDWSQWSDFYEWADERGFNSLYKHINDWYVETWNDSGTTYLSCGLVCLNDNYFQGRLFHVAYNLVLILTAAGMLGGQKEDLWGIRKKIAEILTAHPMDGPSDTLPI